MSQQEKDKYHMVSLTLGFPSGSHGKEICLQCRRPGFDPRVRKIAWRIPWIRGVWQATVHGVVKRTEQLILSLSSLICGIQNMPQMDLLQNNLTDIENRVVVVKGLGRDGVGVWH